MKSRLTLNEYTSGILSGNRAILSKAITLIESKLPSDRLLSQEILQKLLPFTGNSFRIGITGIPGVGKSTFIESFGTMVTQKENKKMAVLAIDPSSQLTKGSIMGDKTRMENLSNNPMAFIRPSPSGSTLGGVAITTRETILLCEAAGFEIILVETVGVGQAETAVKNMTDFFLLLMLAGAGDELQGIKKGIMEMADMVAITKSDGENKKFVRVAKVNYENALHLFPASENGWIPPVLACSAMNGEGMTEIWQEMEKYKSAMQKNDFFNQNRQHQNLKWMYDAVKQQLEERFFTNDSVKKIIGEIEEKVTNGELSAANAAFKLISAFGL